jgi:hypothetical protein
VDCLAQSIGTLDRRAVLPENRLTLARVSPLTEAYV